MSVLLFSNDEYYGKEKEHSYASHFLLEKQTPLSLPSAKAESPS